MEKEKKEWINQIARVACQPARNSWEFWITLLHRRCGVKLEDMLEHKPNLTLICEPILIGRRVKKDGEFVWEKLSPSEGTKLFKEAMKVAEAFQQVQDLLDLASFRRLIGDTEGGIMEIDLLYSVLIKEKLTHKEPGKRLKEHQLEWILERMPPHSWIHAELAELLSQQQMPQACVFILSLQNFLTSILRPWRLLQSSTWLRS